MKKRCKHLFYSAQRKPHCLIDLKENKTSLAINIERCKSCHKYEQSTSSSLD